MRGLGEPRQWTIRDSNATQPSKSVAFSLFLISLNAKWSTGNLDNWSIKRKISSLIEVDAKMVDWPVKHHQQSQSTSQDCTESLQSLFSPLYKARLLLIWLEHPWALPIGCTHLSSWEGPPDLKTILSYLDTSCTWFWANGVYCERQHKSPLVKNPVLFARPVIFPHYFLSHFRGDFWKVYW